MASREGAETSVTGWGKGTVRRTPILSAAFFLLIACSATEERGEEARGGAYQLLPVDSLHVAEHDQVFLGNPFSLVVAREADEEALSEIWVSDFYSNRLWRFDGEGRYVGRVGAPGPGPAEFGAANFMFRGEPGEVAGVDMRGRAVKWFAAGSGELLRIAYHETGRIGGSRPVAWEEDGEPVLVFPLLDRTTTTSVGILHVASGGWRRVGPIPERHRSAVERGAGWFGAFFAVSTMSRLGEESLVLGFDGVETLLAYDLTKGTDSTLGEVPRLFRRGVDHPCVELADHELATATCGPLFDLFSWLVGIWTLPDGRLVLTHVDQHSSGAPPAILLTGEIFLTVLDPSTDEGCVDLRVPGGSDARPVFDVEGSDLFVLDRRLPGVQSEAWLLRVPIPSMDACPEQHRVSGWLR